MRRLKIDFDLVFYLLVIFNALDTATTSTTRNIMASASTTPSTHSQQVIDLSEPRFRGYCWAVDERGLTVLFHPLWAKGTNSLDEENETEQRS